MITDVVILAGGFGERLWPASRADYPKQFMTLGSGVSFLQAAVLRALSLDITGKIILVTRKDLLEPAADHCQRLMQTVSEKFQNKLKNDLYIIAEPEPRHTTAPIILSCNFLDLLDANKEHTMLVLTSDHVITPVENFTADSKKAAECAEHGRFVCYAIPLTEPATGYGYIKTGKAENTDGTVFKIEQFKEKPDQDTALAYFKSGHYWWNSGMFAFTASFFKNELAVCQPDVAKAFEAVAGGSKPVTGYYNGVKYVESWPEMDAAYKASPAIAVDNAIAEKTAHAYAVRASFDWDDVGSWDSFEKLFTENNGRTVEVSSNNCFVYSDIPVALCGVDDLVVVIKNGNALVMKKGASSMVREAVKKIHTAEAQWNN
jgi:mannose-1-phosphate guanylyltransferase